MLLTFLGLASCVKTIELARINQSQRSQQHPAISGNGKLLAVIVDQLGRKTVQLQDLRDGRILPLRHFSGNQPHSSPTISWSGRYLAVITQRGNRRLTIIEDRLNGKVHKIPLPWGRDPISLSLAPDATQLAVQVTNQGHWQVELFDLSQILEPDRPIRLMPTIPSR